MDAVLRRWLTLEYLIDLGLRTPMSGVEADVRAVLLAGAAQLLLLDRVPAHAAIDQSVRYAKQHIRVGAGGLVNAALRRVAELRKERIERPADWAERRDILALPDGRVMLLSGEVLPKELDRRLAIQTSHSAGLIGRWLAMFGEEAGAAIALKSIAPAPTVLNTEADPEAAARLVTKEKAVPHEETDAIVWKGARIALGAELSRTNLWAQDPSSAAVVRFIASLVPPKEVRRVVDLCAGRGTKTRQIIRAFPEASVIAADVDDARLADLAKVMDGVSGVRVMHAGRVREACERAGADLVLLDVPCSNSGVFARRVEARYRINRKSLAELVEMQRGIIATGAACVRAGGRIAYSTCSLEPEENELQKEWMAAEFGAEIAGELRTSPSGGPGGDPSRAHDGSYVTIVRLASSRGHPPGGVPRLHSRPTGNAEAVS